MADETWAIILRYARFARGKATPLTCEVGGTDPTRHSHGKIMYRSVEDAQRAAAEMERAGLDPLAAYQCPRSRHGHAHLTHKGAPTTPDRDRRPEDVPVLPVTPGDEVCPRCGRPWQRPEGVSPDDPRYCRPSCRLNRRKSAKRAEGVRMVAALVPGTALEGVPWPVEFQKAAQKVRAPEEAAALVAAEIARMEPTSP